MNDARTREQITGALYDFLGYLTSRDKAIVLGSRWDAVPAVDALQAWADARGFSIKDADVLHWQDGIE